MKKIDIFGLIGGWEITADYIKNELNNLSDSEEVLIRLHSSGGTFDEGLAIYNLLKNHKGKVTVQVMGYALSMGSFIMLAADEIHASESSIIMIHRASTIAWGDAKDMGKAAEMLQKHDQVVVPVYAQKLNKTEEEVLNLLQAETWFTAKEAKAAGLVDRIVDSSSNQDSSNNANLLHQERQYNMLTNQITELKNRITLLEAPTNANTLHTGAAMPSQIEYDC